MALRLIYQMCTPVSGLDRAARPIRRHQGHRDPGTSAEKGGCGHVLLDPTWREGCTEPVDRPDLLLTAATSIGRAPTQRAGYYAQLRTPPRTWLSACSASIGFFQ